MNDGVRAEVVAQPAVEGDVVVGRGKVGAVIDGDGVFAESARGLYADKGVAQAQARHKEAAVVGIDAAGRLAPRLRDVGLDVGGQGSELRLV